MFNATLIKNLREHPIGLSDVLRDEGQVQTSDKLTRLVTNLQSYYVVKRYARGDAKRFAKAIFKHQTRLSQLNDNDLVSYFYDIMASFTTSSKRQTNLALAFACIGEGIYRHFEFYPHDVQYLGAAILLQGKLAEMQTGEGKTIVAAIATIFAAASGAAVHVLSTNEYLANRDREEMQPVFEFFNLSSGAIQSEMQIEERKVQYRNAICYVSASELVFDVLKDEMNADNKITRTRAKLQDYLGGNLNANTTTSSSAQDNLIVPALHFCIVDEADSVLIDEASTPLIISQEGESIMEDAVLVWALNQAKQLQQNQHFSIDWTHRDIHLLEERDYPLVVMPNNIKPMWHTRVWQQILLKKALTALHLFQPDEHYILQEGKVVIVDESTGRPMPDRSWEQGLHQLIEIKEGVEISKARQTIAQITFQRFFKRYLLLSGLTGTVAEVSREMWHVYGLKVCVIPPNRKNKRRQLPLYCFTEPNKKWQAVAEDAIRKVQAGQPVLIGTRSVEASETIMALIQQRLTHLALSAPYTLYLLNARQNAEEAEIVAKAGISGTLTIATNMAGRGTDIKLDNKAKSSGGLHVILTEHHDSKRIDRQLIGRSARQGDAGSYREIVCFKDSILLSNPNLYQTLGQWLPTQWIKRWCYQRAIAIAQQRARQRQYEIRMNTLKQDHNRQKQIGFMGQLR